MADTQGTGARERVVPFTTDDGVELNLINVRPERGSVSGPVSGPAKGPVMLVHGAGVRANIFRAPVPTTIVDALVDRGYDVWLENWRASIDFAPNHWTLDQAARYDHPAAVRTVVAETGQERIKAIIVRTECREFVENPLAHVRAFRLPRQIVQSIGAGIQVYRSRLLPYITAETPQQALELARKTWEGDPDAIHWEHYCERQCLTDIVVMDESEDVLLAWKDPDESVRLAAPDLLEALEAQAMADADPEASERKGYFERAREMRRAALKLAGVAAAAIKWSPSVLGRYNPTMIRIPPGARRSLNRFSAASSGR